MDEIVLTVMMFLLVLPLIGDLHPILGRLASIEYDIFNLIIKELKKILIIF
jgi:hypothetical protein